MKLLILGGTGNISTAITRALQGRGHHLTLFNHDPQRPDWLHPDVEVISGDRKDHARLVQQLSGLGPWDCVIDMIAFEPEDAENDVRVFRHRTRQFVFCSTVDVYEKSPCRYPVSEENAVLGARPSFPYGWKKLQCERTLWAAHARGDFALTVLRPTFTYNETWSPGIHAFGGQTYHLDRLLKGKPILLHGDGTSIWVATHRDDTARAFVGAAGNERAFGQAYNVSGDEWMTHRHIWQTLARLLGAPEPDFVCIPTDLLGRLAPEEAAWCVENFRYNNIFDNAKAKRDLGFRYTVMFEDGARRCLDWLRANNRIEDSAKYPFYDRILEAWCRHTAAMLSPGSPVVSPADASPTGSAGVSPAHTTPVESAGVPPGDPPSPASAGVSPADASPTGSAGVSPASSCEIEHAAGTTALPVEAVPQLKPSFVPASASTARVVTQVVASAPHLGWHSRGFLPHWDHPGMIQAITFRLHDSVPAEVIQKWKAELIPCGGVTGSADVSAATDPGRIELARRIAWYEDAGHGACWLRDKRLARLVEDAILHFDGERYRLLAWCVMPNHVHTLIETIEGWPVGDVVHSWKSFTAHEANKILERQGVFGQREYHDRYIRNAEHYAGAIRYVEENPVKAGIVMLAVQWPWSSARFRAGNAGLPPEDPPPTGSAVVSPADPSPTGSAGVAPASFSGVDRAAGDGGAPGPGGQLT